MQHIPHPETQEGIQPTAQPVRLILGAVAAVMFVASLGQTIVSTALPVIVADLNGLDHITWVITAYLLASTVSAPIYGKLGDLFGRKVVIQAGIVIFLLGSIICGLAPSMNILVAGRLVQGLGGGGLMVVAMAVVADVLPARDRGRVQGLLGAVFGVSTVLGPLLGGFFVEQMSWHAIFFFNVPIGLATMLVLGYALRVPQERVGHQIDYLGAGLLTTALALLVLISSMGGTTFAWGSGQMLGLIALAVASLVGFALSQSRAAEPILPLSLFRNNNFVITNIVGFMVGVAMFGTLTFMPLFLQVVKGVSPAMSGILLLPMTAGLLGSSTLAGFHMSRTGKYKQLPIYSTALLAASTLALAWISPQTPNWLIVVLVFLVGMGIGPVFSIGVTAIQNAVPVSMLGVGTASANMFRMIGGAIGTSAFGAIFAARLGDLVGDALPVETGGVRAIGPEMVAALPPDTRALVLEAFSQALQPIFIIGAVLALVATVASVFLRELPLATTLEPRK